MTPGGLLRTDPRADRKLSEAVKGQLVHGGASALGRAGQKPGSSEETRLSGVLGPGGLRLLQEAGGPEAPKL